MADATDLVTSPNLITQDFGCTSYSGEWIDPSCPGGHRHCGVDIGFPGGSWPYFRTPIYTPQDAIVVAVGADGSGANFVYDLGDSAVCLRLPDGTFLEFGHCDQALVSVGQHVKAGDQVALLGTKGQSSAPHLHVEHRSDGPYQSLANLLDPMPLLWIQRPKPKVMADNAQQQMMALGDA